MKKVLFFAALAAAAFTSCQKSDVTGTSDKEVNFMIERYVTRVTTDKNVSQFEEGDVIAVTSDGLYADITDAKYTVGATNLTGETAVYYKYDQTASFTAHYPANLNNVDGAITMTVASDQSDATKFHNNMFMVATARGSKLNNNVTFSFAHQLAMVKVMLKGFDANSLSLLNVLPEVTWNNGQLEAAAGTATSIKSFMIDQNEFWVLLPAQTINPGEFISINATDGKVYTFTLGSALTLNTAKVKTVTLSINGSEVVMSSALEDVEWTDEDTVLDGKVDGEEYIPVVLLNGDETLTLPAEKATNATSGVAGWNWVLGNATSGATVTQDNELSITFSEASGWTGNGLFYSFSEEQINKIKTSQGIFKLTFMRKNTANIRFLAYTEDGVSAPLTNYTDYAEGVLSGSNTTRTLSAANDYATQTYYFDLKSFSKNSLFIFIGLSSSGTYEAQVKNVKFEEVL